MENLTKQNYWNQLHIKYPDAVDLFCKWIDNYKKEVNWDSLFRSFTDEANGAITPVCDIKFHDIPFEMQNGIIARFDIECFNGVLTGKGKAIYENNRTEYVQGFTNLFADLQNKINNQKQ